MIARLIKILLIIEIAFGAYPHLSFAESLDPYSFDQTRNLQPVLQENFLPPVLAAKKSKPLPKSAPTSPTIVTDQDGNKFIYVDGELRVKFDPEGNQVYFAKRQARFERDYEGSLTKLYEYAGPRAKLKNEWGEVIGYQDFGQGGLLLKESDEEDNLAKTYLYQDRNLEWILDNLYDSKTKYNLDGPQYETDFEGNISAYYITSNRRIQKKIEKTVNEKGEAVDGDCTVYDETGKYPLYKTNFEGNTVLTYNYGEFNRLKDATDQYGNATEYKTGRPQLIRHKPTGLIFKAWKWQGTKLLSSTDLIDHSILGLDSGITTYYKNGKAIEARLYNRTDDGLVALWVYSEGRLIGEWQAGTDGSTPNQVILYDHGRPAVAFLWKGNSMPTKEEVLNWVKPKKTISINGSVRGLWDSEKKELMVFDEQGEIIKVLPRETLPTQEELTHLF